MASHSKKNAIYKIKGEGLLKLIRSKETINTSVLILIEEPDPKIGFKISSANGRFSEIDFPLYKKTDSEKAIRIIKKLLESLGASYTYLKAAHTFAANVRTNQIPTIAKCPYVRAITLNREVQM